MTVYEWFNTPIPWVGSVIFFAILGVTALLERGDRLRQEQEDRIERRRRERGYRC